MDTADFLEDIFVTKPKPGLGDYHLRSALTKVSLVDLRARKGRFREVVAFQNILSYVPYSVMKEADHSSIVPYLTSCTAEHTPRSMCKEELLTLLRIENEALNGMCHDAGPFEKSIQFIEKNDLCSIYTKIKTELLIGLMCTLAKSSQRQMPASESINHQDDYSIQRIGDAVLTYWGDLITLRRGKGAPTEVLSLDQFRMVCDKVTERDNVLISAGIGASIFPDIYPSPLIIQAIFDLFDNHLIRRGNDGYKLLKTYEALVTGVILQRERSSFCDTEIFLISTVSELESEIDRDTARRFVGIIHGVKTVHHLTQICGLFRLWGHPIIDAKKGMEKVKTIAMKDKVINEVIANNSGRSFKEEFFSNYFQKNGKYPCYSSKGKDGYLMECLEHQKPFSRQAPNYHWSSWDSIQCEKTFDVPETFNLSMIVADTAISPTRAELKECGDQGKVAIDPTIRRGVIKWMKDGMINCGELLRKINSHPVGLPKQHRVIGLYPKEREMNPTARMFALTSLLLRSYVVVTEAMLSDHILEFFPGITMTHSLLRLTKEMIKMTWRQKSDSSISRTFCMNMDFEKWNLNMCKEATSPVFTQLGRLFGLPELYNRTYDIFTESAVYLADGSYIPKFTEDLDPIEDESMYIGHERGFEGLRQKGWTIFTVSVIRYVCNELNIDWKLMGQGDNQVLMVTIFSKFARRYGISSDQAIRDIRGQLGRLRERLILEFDQLGLSLKPLETWISDSFFSYGKTPLFKGVPCATSLKKISRIFFFSNEDLMTLDNALGAVGANAQSAVMGDVHPIVPYVIAKWQQLMCIKIFRSYHPLVGEGLTQIYNNPVVMFNSVKKQKSCLSISYVAEPKTEIMVLATIPKTLSGYNIITYFRMMMRGFPDPQNMDYQWLVAVSSRATGDLKIILDNFISLMINPEVNYSYLLQDVTGLNLYIPTNSTQVVKDMVHKTIDGLNFKSEFSQWFKVVLKCSERSTIDKLSESLCSGDTLNVRVLHDVIGATLYGYCDSITSKIDKTVTLSRIALGQEDVVSVLISNEVRFFSFLRWRMCVKGNLPYNGECPSRYIRRARRVGWKKELLGVDTPYPFHFMSENQENTTNPDSFVRVSCDDRATSSQTYMINTVGNALPYLGSVTKEKLGASSQRLSYGNEPLLTRPVNLLRTVGWFVEEESNLANLFVKLIQAISDLDPEGFFSNQEKIKGSMAHRYNDSALKHGSLWMPLFGPATFLNISTNDFIEFAKGSKNATVHFQALICFCQYWALDSLLAQFSQKVLKLYKVCNDCITEVPESYPDLPLEIPSEMIPSHQDNPYLFITKDRIPVEIKQTRRLVMDLPIYNYIDRDEGRLISSLTSWLALKVVSSVMNNADNSHDMGLIDISGIPRTVFLKLDPIEVLKDVNAFFFINVARQPKYQRYGVFPSWSLVKDDIARSVARANSHAFSELGGFFLWKESKARLESNMRIIHSSFPMSANSISQACKEILLKSILTGKDIYFKRRLLVVQGDEQQAIPMLKCVLLARVRSLNESCASCEKTILHLDISLDTEVAEINTKRCEEGHFLLPVEREIGISKTPNLTVEALFDSIGALSYDQLTKNGDGELNLRDLMSINAIQSVLTNDDLMYGEYPEELGDYKMTRCYSGYLLRFGTITRGIYRSGELLTSGKIIDKGNLLILGDGYGGTSLGMSCMGNWGKIISWTYLDISSGIPHSANLSRPPLHFQFDQNIDNTPSFEKVSIVGHPGFKRDMLDVVRSNNISTVVSDIEWWYLGDDKTEDLIQCCWEARVPSGFIRLFLGSKRDFGNIVRHASTYYHSIDIFFTDSASPHNKSCWMKLRSPRPIAVHGVRHLHPSVHEKFQLAVAEFENSESGIRQCSHVDQIIGTSLTIYNYFKDELDLWFRNVGLVGYLEGRLTKLFLSIRTGRRPIEVTDLGSNTIYHDREITREGLLLRLLALMLSLYCDSSENESILKRHWELVWGVVKNPGSIQRRYIRSNIILQSSMRRRGNLSQDQIREVLAHVPLLKELREEKSRIDEMENVIFFRIGSSVTFKYSLHEQELFFPISKILGYNTY